MKRIFYMFSISFAVILSNLEQPLAQSRFQEEIPAGGGIQQLVRLRGQQTACAGLLIHLKQLTFKKVIQPNQISVREGKYGRELRDEMLWQVGKNGKSLTIAYRNATADFGTGNGVEIQIERSAFVEPIKSPNNRFEWSIVTDVL
jgi:hypothetical protein